MEEEKIIDSHFKDVSEFFEEYLLPEAIAYYIAIGFYKNNLYENSIDVFVSSVLAEFFNYEVKDMKSLIKNVKKLLKIKYKLVVINEAPLKFKKQFQTKNGYFHT